MGRIIVTHQVLGKNGITSSSDGSQKRSHHNAKIVTREGRVSQDRVVL